MQAVGFTSVCSTWCRGRGQSGAVISWYAAVRNEARARRMMLRGDDFWQFASNTGVTGRLVEKGSKCTPTIILGIVYYYKINLKNIYFYNI